MKAGSAVLAALLLAGCSFGKDIAAADAGVSAFHASLNAGDVDRIASTADPELGASPSRVEFGKLLEAVHRKLGIFVSGNRTGFNDRADLQGHFITVVYASTYQRGAAQETFVFRVSDGRAKVAGYNINSAALITN